MNWACNKYKSGYMNVIRTILIAMQMLAHDAIRINDPNIPAVHEGILSSILLSIF
jgi:hypothetical protein